MSITFNRVCVLAGAWVCMMAVGTAAAKEPSEILDALEKKFNRLHSVHFKMTITQTGSGREQKSTHEVWLKRDDEAWKERRAVSSESSAGEGQDRKSSKHENVTICDGEHCYREMRIGEQVLVFRSPQELTQDIDFVRELLRKNKGVVKSGDKIVDQKCVLIEITESRRREEIVHSFYFSEENGLLMKKIQPMADGTKLEAVVTKLELNVDVADSKFEYEVPDGAQVFDTEEMGKSGQ